MNVLKVWLQLSSSEEILEVMFGLDHIIAEFFWNGIFLVVGLGISKAKALRKIHKYIDDKHGVSHEKEGY